MHITKRFFPGLILFLFLAVPVLANTVHADTVPLVWSDTKKELKPGYSITISVHAEGNGVQGLADAGFKLETSDGYSWLYGITQDGRDVVIVMEGAGIVAKLDTLYPWEITRHTYDDTFYVKVYCPGTAPPGETPRDGKIWVEVRDQYTGTTRYYLATDPGPGQVVLNVYWYTESATGLSSKVVLGEPTKHSACGDQYAGDNPSGNESSEGGENQNRLDIEEIAKWSLGIIALAVFLIVLSSFKR